MRQNKPLTIILSFYARFSRAFLKISVVNDAFVALREGRCDFPEAMVNMFI